jgi:hypothetical protein
MSKHETMKSEMRQSLRTNDPVILRKVEEEFDLLEVSEGLESKNNLEAFYDIWRKHNGELGTRMISIRGRPGRSG